MQFGIKNNIPEHKIFLSSSFWLKVCRAFRTEWHHAVLQAVLHMHLLCRQAVLNGITKCCKPYLTQCCCGAPASVGSHHTGASTEISSGSVGSHHIATSLQPDTLLPGTRDAALADSVCARGQPSMHKMVFLGCIAVLRAERCKWETERLRVQPFIDRQRRKFLLPTFNTWAFGIAALAACRHRVIGFLPSGLGWGPWRRSPAAECDEVIPGARQRWIAFAQRSPCLAMISMRPPPPEIGRGEEGRDYAYDTRAFERSDLSTRLRSRMTALGQTPG